MERNVPSCALRSSSTSSSSPKAEDGANQHLQHPLRRPAPGRSSHTQRPSSMPPPTHVVRSQHRAHIFLISQKLQGLCPTLFKVNVDPCTGARRHLYVTSADTSHSANEASAGSRPYQTGHLLGLSLVERARTYEGPQRAGTSSTHPSQFQDRILETIDWYTSTSTQDHPHRERSGLHTVKNPVRRQVDSTVQATPNCRLYSYLSSQYIFNYLLCCPYYLGFVGYPPPRS